MAGPYTAWEGSSHYRRRRQKLNCTNWKGSYILCFYEDVSPWRGCFDSEYQDQELPINRTRQTSGAGARKHYSSRLHLRVQAPEAEADRVLRCRARQHHGHLPESAGLRGSELLGALAPGGEEVTRLHIGFSG